MPLRELEENIQERVYLHGFSFVLAEPPIILECCVYRQMIVSYIGVLSRILLLDVQS